KPPPGGFCVYGLHVHPILPDIGPILYRPYRPYAGRANAKTPFRSRRVYRESEGLGTGLVEIDSERGRSLRSGANDQVLEVQTTDPKAYRGGLKGRFRASRHALASLGSACGGRVRGSNPCAPTNKPPPSGFCVYGL